MNTNWLDTNYLSPQKRFVNFRWAEESRPNVKFVELEKASVRVRSAGEGEMTVVFLTDPPNVIEHYDRLFELISTWARVVCIETPGFGFSFPKSNFDFTLADYTDAIAEALTKLKISPVVLVLPCVTTYIGLKLAAAQPQLVSKLFLMQAPNWTEEIKWAKRIDSTGIGHKPFFGQIMMMLGKNMFARKWYSAALANKERVPKFAPQALEANNHGACFCLASFTQTWFGANEPSFAKIHQPSQVLWGLADRSHYKSRKETILEYVPDANYLKSKTVGHFPELEEPENFSEHLKRFALS